jgi:quinol-cytochrome oxidoreductase complex cytochrome b subunit
MSARTWLQERIPISGEQLKELTNEPVPNHLKSWWFCLGGTVAYCFIVQIVTGILLAFYYQATPDKAWESVRFITEDVAYGWFLRSLHKWGATLMIAALVLHQMRVFFTGAYRRPREINWMIGMALLIVTLLTGFTGYSLVYEQLSYWGATVGANITDSVPVIGPAMKKLLLAGEVYNEHTLSRFYVLHAALLPVTLIILVGIHLALVRVHGVTEYTFEGETPAHEGGTFDFFPDHFYMELIVGLALMIVLTTLAVVAPAEMGPKANPLATPEIIKPEWFFYVAFRWLKLFSAGVAMLSMSFIILVMVMWPFIDERLRKTTRIPAISTYIGIVAVLMIITMTVWEAVVAH